MSLAIDKNIIIINVPNSEAAINAQHHGIKDRTVGMYYLSEMYDEVNTMLALEDECSKYYIDFVKTYKNAKSLYDLLVSKNMNQAFKSNLDLMKIAINSMERQIEQGSDLLEIDKPTINEQKKYIKFNNENAYFTLLREVCLGDLSKIKIQRLSKNCFRIYMETVDNLNDLIYKGTIKEWCI